MMTHRQSPTVRRAGLWQWMKPVAAIGVVCAALALTQI